MLELQVIPQVGLQNGIPVGYLPYAFVVAEIARGLVDEPDRVVVETVSGGTGTTLVLTVSSADLGKVLGKQGRTVRSLRMILSAMSRKSGRGLLLEVRAERRAGLKGGGLYLAETPRRRVGDA